MKNKKIAVMSTLLFFAPVTATLAACSNETADQQKELVKIAVTKNPTKMEYEVGEKIDITGMSITATYSDGSTEDVTSKCTTNKDGVSLTETDRIFYVKYTYEGKTKTVPVNITIKTDPKLDVTFHDITAISDFTFPWKAVENETADYKFWTYYDSTTLKCDATLLLNKTNDEEGTFKFVELNDYFFNPETNINEYKGGIILGSYKINANQIKLSTTDVYRTVNVTTGEPIHETSKYEEAQYEIGTIIKENDEIVGIQMGELLKSSDTFFGWGKTKASAFIENISTQFNYDETQVYFDIVKDNQRSSTQKSYWAPKYADSIEINQAPVKTSYYVGETFSTTGLELKVNYTDGTNGVITEGFSIDKTEPLTITDKVITISYMGKTTTLEINVTPAPSTAYIEALEVTNAPVILEYHASDTTPSMETLVKSYGKSMVVKAKFSDGTEQVINDYTIEGTFEVPTETVLKVSTSYSIKYTYEGRTAQEIISNVTVSFINPMDVVKTSDADLVFFTYFTKGSNKVNAALELKFAEESSTNGKFNFVGYSSAKKASFLSGDFAINEDTITFNNASISIPLASTSMFKADEETATLVKDGNTIKGINFGSFVDDGIFGYSFAKISDLTANISDVYYPETEGTSSNAYMHLATLIDFDNETVASNVYYKANY